MSYVPQPQSSGSTLVGTRDQIRTNFEKIQTQFNQNHVDIQSSGKHKFLQMPDQSSAPDTAANEIGFYSKDVSGVSTGYFRAENNGSEYRVTAFDDVNFATFGTNTEYSAGLFGGWTFLPGGLILQYGFAPLLLNGTNIILYPKSFSANAYSITYRTGGSSQAVTLFVDQNTTRFRVTTNNTLVGLTTLAWQAIGPA